MTPSSTEPPESMRTRAVATMTLLLFLALLATHTHAQSQAAKLADIHSGSERPTTQSYKTFYLSNISSNADANELQTALRNMIPAAKLYYVPSQSAISIRGSDEDIALAQKILADLDRTRKAYRLTYTISETDNGQPSGKRHVTMVVASGSQAQLKQGSKVPLVTGNYPEPNGPSHSDVQYQDIGLQIEATLNGYADGVHLHSKIEESSISDERSGIGTQDPVFRQTMLDSTATLVPGKPLMVGSLDMPGTNRHQQIEVVAEAVP